MMRNDYHHHLHRTPCPSTHLVGVTWLIHCIADIFDNRAGRSVKKHVKSVTIEYHKTRMKE